MEPNKLEQDIKQKMEQRTIQPTEMAWDRLDAMLTVAEKKKPNRTWMYMAASFLALLLVGTLFLNREKESGTNTTNTNSIVTIEKQPDVLKEEVTPTEVSTPVIEQEAVATTTNAPAKTIRNNAKVNINHKTDSNQNTAVATHINTVNENITVITKEPAVIVSNTTVKKITVDANSLLASVDRTSVTKPATNNPVAINPAVKQASVKVNANSLLSSVEGELDDSFRSRVLQTVSKNYNKVKTSVATRNRQ
jgi:hypothetical protein